MTAHSNGRRDDVNQNPRRMLESVAAVLNAAGFYAYTTLDDQSRWTVACDTDEGHVDVRVVGDTLELDVWDTSPGLFIEEEDERRRAAKERLARVSLPALARGFLNENQEVWWDETDHGVGVRMRFYLPAELRDELGTIAKARLAELNDLIAFIETKLTE